MKCLRKHWLMGMLGLALALPVLAAAEERSTPSAKETRAAMERGSRWLAEQQDKDGGWHSATYGALKAGPAVTALVVDTLGRLPADLRSPHRAAADKGLAFLERGRNSRGALAAHDGSLDYPTYATAYGLLARRRWNMPLGVPDERGIAYLLGAQLVEARGITADHPAHGGWDLLGPGDANGVTTGSNISITVTVLAALADHDDPGVTTARRHAAAWLLRGQSYARDGGFPFSPETGEHLHKGGLRDEKPLRPFSYGSTTADGLRGLLASGLTAEDKQVGEAIRWLEKRRSLEVVPGFEQLSPEIDWQRGLRFYYYQSLAQTLSSLSPTDRAERRAALSKLLLAEQRGDGSWANPSARMREDDPLIATSFALTALAALATHDQ